MATYRFNKSGICTLDWRDSTGRHRISLGRISERDAKKITAARNAELAFGTQLLNFGPSSTLQFGDFCKDYLLWHATEYPSSHFRVLQLTTQYLLPEFEFTALDTFKTTAVEAYKTKRRVAGAAPQTITKELRTLKAILNRAVELGELAKTPLQHVKEPQNLNSKPKEYYTAEELYCLYEHSSRKAVWQLYVNTGMRRMEGMHLKWKDVTPYSVRVLSTDEERSKSGKWREIPQSEGAREALQLLRNDDVYVLPRMHPASLSRAFINEAAAAGIGGSLHMLRHTFISHLVMHGVDLRTVQVLAGHSTISVTEGYAHLAPSHLADSVLKLKF